MKVAIVQMDSGRDKGENLIKAITFVRRAIEKRAEFILLPEVFNYRGPASNIKSVAEDIPGESTLPLIELAQKYKVHILAGSIYEKIPKSRKVYNTSVLIGPRGRREGKYRKMNLFRAAVAGVIFDESKFFLAGQKPAMAKVKNFKLGMSICYDLRFPELYRHYALAGAHILSVPSSFTRPTGRAHFEALLRARAIENLCFVLAPNQTGKDARGVLSYGGSMIIDPWGKVLAKASCHEEEVIYADLDKSSLLKRRKTLPAILKK